MDDFISELSDISIETNANLGMETDLSSKASHLRKHIDRVIKLFNSSTIRVPDFGSGLDWINVTEPLSLHRDLKGKVVVLDFFTYCCINCLHILPDLKRLEEEISVKKGLVVCAARDRERDVPIDSVADLWNSLFIHKAVIVEIGVHSAKFTNERETGNIESAVRRYEITHPVINDNRESMWRALSIQCWPTMCVLGPNAEPLMIFQGEGNFENLRLLVKVALQYFDKHGALSLNPLPQIKISSALVTSSLLSYPGKVTIREDGSCMAISDTSHHRILLVSLDGYLLDEIGGLESGFCDGDYSSARFFSPQGLTFVDNVLFVADTENHAVRKIDLSTKNVSTLVGNGKQGNDYKGGLDGKMQEISSPWDVCAMGPVLLIAAAGTHQVWAYFFEDYALWKRKHPKGTCAAIIGSGREENRNNFYPTSCGLAQPSGLALSPSASLFIADSESSTIRSVELSSGKVMGLVGGVPDPRNLFAFGDKDGSGMEVKLQHPLGVTWSPFDQNVYVADSYNHKIKRINPSSKCCTTIEGCNSIKLNEPGGLCAFNNKIYIADTNNHRIVVMSLPDNTFSEVLLKTEKAETHASSKNQILHDAHISPEGGDLSISIALSLPPGHQLTKNAPSSWSLSLPDGTKQIMDKFTLEPNWTLHMPKSGPGTIKNIRIKGRIFLCIEDTCTVKEIDFLVSVRYSSEAPKSPSLKIEHLFSKR